MNDRSAADDPVVDAMVEAIVDEVDPQMVVLFGSRLRGQKSSDSDVDLLVVEDQSFGEGRSRRAEAARLHRRLAGSGVPKDILVVTGTDVEKWRGSVNHVIVRALREGRVVDGRR
jgi:predicted nucleotidyltransferase